MELSQLKGGEIIMKQNAKPREWLKKIRNEKNLTQQDVADSGNFARTYYTMVEQGKRTPSVEVAKSIAKVLGFEWTIFFADKCNESKHYVRNKDGDVAI